jgi:murein DD-endopeptidase MepM/ murein hydrolase activator NlpD
MKKCMKIRNIVPIVGVLCLSAVSSCRQELVPEAYQPSNAHEAYLYALEQAGLADSALARDWNASAQECLDRVIPITPPFQEIFYVDPKEAFSVAYRFEVLRGQRTEIQVDLQGEEQTRIFMDLFRVEGDSPEYWVPVASAPEAEYRLEFEPRLTLPYAVRIQPELLRGGRFTITIRNVASLEFPVAGADSRDIGSGFGAPRDGGRRRHHGVDIFAPRHTFITAPSDGRVLRAGEQRVGGRTIWIRDEKRNLTLYFAHLQAHKVEQNAIVKKGQVIGTVGNTGNARTTPPHLHFAIYIRGSGPVDPVNFITRTNDIPRPITADLQLLGSWARSSTQPVFLRTSPEPRAEQAAELDQYVPMQVLAAAVDRYRVRLPDGTSGYVPAASLESVLPGLQSLSTADSLAVQDSPRRDGIVKSHIESGSGIELLGRYSGYWLVETESGLIGWASIPTPAASSSRQNGTVESDG